MGIQKKRKELTKTFMMISNCKKNCLVFMVYTEIFRIVRVKAGFL